MTEHQVERLSGKTVASYAALGFAIKALTLPLISYLPPAFAQATGLSLATIGILFMVARLWDIVLDPVAGFLIDRFDPPLGPRKFWLLAAAPLLLFSIPPLFMPVRFGVGVGGDIVGPVLLLLIFYFGWTVMSVAHATWPTDLAARSAERTRLIAWREWAGVIGMIAIVATPALAEHIVLGRLVDQLGTMGVFAMIAIPITLAVTIAFLPPSPRRQKPATDPLELFRLLGGSGALRRLLLADLLSGSGFAMISATAFFILGQYLGLAGSFSMLMLVYFIGMIVGVPAFMRLTIRIGAKPSFAVAMTGAAASTLCLALVPHGAFYPAMLVQFGTGIFTGGYQTNLNTVMVDVADRHRRTSGHDASGAHFALLAVTNKFGYALAIGISYPLLQMLGFHPGGKPSLFASDILLTTGLGGAALFLILGGLAMPSFQDKFSPVPSPAARQAL